MALLFWDVLNLVLFVGSRGCFLYSSLTIPSSFSHSSFHHASVSLLFVCDEVLGIVFSAACSMVLNKQPRAYLIMFWFCTFIVFVLSFWNCNQFALFYAPSLLLFHGNFRLLWWCPSDHFLRVHILCSIQVPGLLLSWQLLVLLSICCCWMLAL